MFHWQPLPSMQNVSLKSPEMKNVCRIVFWSLLWNAEIFSKSQSGKYTMLHSKPCLECRKYGMQKCFTVWNAESMECRNVSLKVWNADLECTMFHWKVCQELKSPARKQNSRLGVQNFLIKVLPAMKNVSQEVHNVSLNSLMKT